MDISTSMRRLMLLRHAKSAWNTPGLADVDRPLNARGREAAPRMGTYMMGQGLVPDLAVVSAAKRTRETWALVAPAFGTDIATTFEPAIYEAAPQTLMSVARATSPAVRTLLMVGHNPGMETLAALLVAGGAMAGGAAFLPKFPTAALAVIDLDVTSWAEVGHGKGALERFVTPKSIGAVSEDE